LGTNNGLENNWVTTVEEDMNGIAWVGTIVGLYRWDGISLQKFLPDEEDSTSISSPNIEDVMPDIQNNRVWVSHGEGLSVYNTISKTFTNFKHDPGDSLSIPDRDIRRIYKDSKGQIWIGMSRSGLLRYNDESKGFDKFLCNAENINQEDGLCLTSVIDIKEDLANDSILWLGTSSGIIRFNSYTGNFDQYRFKHKDPVLERQYNNIRFLNMNPNGTIYYAIWWYGLCAFDTKTQEFERIDPEYKKGTSAPGRDLINSFYNLEGDRFWVNANKGMQLYDISENAIIEEHNNTDFDWFSIDHVDKQGRIWSATHNRGLIIWDPLFQQYQVSYYADYDMSFRSYTRKIVEGPVDGKLYIASEFSKGLYIYDRYSKNWELIPPPTDFNYRQMGGFQSSDLIFLDNNTLLVIEDSGLFYYKPGFERLKRYALQPDKGQKQLRKIVKGLDGKYWISSASGSFYRLDVEKQEILDYKDRISEAIPGGAGSIYMTVDQSGNIWIMTSKGLLIYNIENDRFIYHEKDRFGGKLDVLYQFSADDNGRVWIGSERKIGYGHKDSLETGIINYITKEDGLTGSRVVLSLPVGDTLLVLTDKAVQEMDLNTLEFKRSFYHVYGPQSALLCMLRLKDKTYVHGKIRGIAFNSLDSVKINEVIPRPYLISMHAFDDLIPVSGNPEKTDSIFLSYKQNFFSFEFSAINYNLPDLTRFEYMLEGYDDEWIDGTKRRFASYTKVPGGEYRFLVRAINNEGLGSDNYAVTYLKISTVWWKTLWFLGGLGLLIFSLIFSLYKYRIAKVRKEEQLKREYERKLADVELSALRAQMNPHFIFNSLNSIEYYIISNEPAKASDYLNRFSRLIRLILQNSKSTIVPLKDDLEALKLYIELESMRFEQLFNYEVKLEKGIDTEKTMVPPMLLQPYVENAIWHGLLQKKEEQGKIEVSISMDGNSLNCIIEDNGIGREASEKLKSKTATKKKSFGMKITKDRLDVLNKLAGTNASVRVIDRFDEDGKASGTRVELFIPV